MTPAMPTPFPTDKSTAPWYHSEDKVAEFPPPPGGVGAKLPRRVPSLPLEVPLLVFPITSTPLLSARAPNSYLFLNKVSQIPQA